MSSGSLSAIHVYPVKSCRRIDVDATTVTDLGLAGDRVWQVVNAKGHPLTQRQAPALATVQPELVEGGMRLSAPGRHVLELATAGPTTIEVKSLFGITVHAADAGDAVAAWFSELIGQPCRLAGISDGGGWQLPEKFELHDQPMAFSDAAPILVTNTASLRWLEERAMEPFGMDRFRPNLVINCDEPWVEDTWRDFDIGTASLRADLPCPRCAVPQIDQMTATRHNEPARVLREHRWCETAAELPTAVRPIVEGNGLFGVYCTIGPAGTTVAIGDELTVNSSGAPIIAPPD